MKKAEATWLSSLNEDVKKVFEKVSTSELVKTFLEATREEQEHILKNMTPKAITVFMNELAKTSSNLFQVIEDNNGKIRNLTEKYKKEKEDNYIKEKLEKLKVFDQSDIRLNIHEFDFREMGVILARTHDDHIEILCNSWFSETRTFEQVLYTINHESIHPVIDKIFYEDGFVRETGFDSEWAFYAGGIDEILGVNHSMHAPMYYLTMDAIRNTMMLDPAYTNLYHFIGKNWLF